MNIIQKKYEYLILLTMIYVSCDLSSMVFSYKIIEIGPVIGAASSLIFPLTYAVMDIVAEVFGYRIAKKVIWYGFLCDLIFVSLVVIVSHIPSPNEQQSSAYLLVFGSLFRAVFAQVIGVICGGYVNVYLISKWKLLTNGRYFWLRSIGSSSLGEGVMLLISVTIALVGILPISKILQLVVYTYIYKVVFAVLIAPIIAIIAVVLKNLIEKCDEKKGDPIDTFYTQSKMDLFSIVQR